MILKEFKYKQLNGILRYFYDKGRASYGENVQISSSSDADGTRTSKKAFDFVNSTHWIGNTILPNQSLSFCFHKKYHIFVSEYELLTSVYDVRPRIWSFAGSNEHSNWANIEEKEYSMPRSGTVRVAWNHGPYRCFKLTSIKSTSDYYSSFDVAQIELYGILVFKGVFTRKCRPFNCCISLLMLIMLS